MTRLTPRDQLVLQEIVIINVRAHGAFFYFSTSGKYAEQILQRHGVDVSLDVHTGRVTFNPEVVEA